MVKPEVNTVLVSICIPTYNGAEYLKETLDSVKQQTFKDFEVIVSDDNSKDNTLNIVEQFKKCVDVPVKTYNHEPQGIGANWNFCVQKATGKYIKFLFQDDILAPTCLEQMVILAETNEAVGLVYAKRDFLFDTDASHYTSWLKKCGVLHESWASLDVEEGIMPGKAYLRDKNLLDMPNNKIGEPSLVLLRKDVFDKVGFFNTELSQTLDFEYWYRLMPYYNVGFVNDYLLTFRLHQDQATQKNNTKKTKDAVLLPRLLMKNLFWYLHARQRIYLIKEVFYISYFFKQIRKIKKKILKIW
ncbi:glycosyltransferase involved in cell wall biosynthesis [Mesoflavibacter sabulilitoris]|uniref:Glycosyltransferase 2-like domain-containing protein n=1 Tax=Mesoflavibacter zeaxanthinifaciens subsp. sabulilitoris TaxID=1520893 RepID=A0A2T1NB27_9FLAO|nr:glycosyltransferase family 2 protein [Mesoflavibacter zeaxanthinifaciens]MBB3123541.1 glycosyltransferase involved in cell wall biosynthesis [Mesoflavibacter zeaxanthinifaciens subsp. sabulilitoris]PSG89328.1 hypothetical protein C7H61_10270 [Mesoflavibacter zeaxanthinifaciens subsp. sabulilitoris]